MVGVFNIELLSWEYATRELRRQGLHNHAAEHPPPEQPPKSEPLPMVADREIRDQGEESKSESEPQSESESESQGVNEPEWIISIKERLEEAIQEDVAGSKGKCCIYKVPHFLRNEGDDKAYTPQVVSIGPYHRGRPQLVAMDRHKWRALYHILDREQQDVALYVNAMKELEGRTRGCYENPLNLESNEFVEMMVLDGCFVIELLKGCVEGFENLGYERNDPVFAMRGMMSSVQRDMMMIENQIPLFVLDRLVALQLGSPVKKGLIAELALRFFDPMFPTDETLITGQKIKLESSVDAKEVKLHLLPDESGLHCLDLFRSSLLRKDLEREPRLSDRKWSLVVRQKLIRSITELKESGVEFKKRKTDIFWDIKFKNGVLQIPRLLVQDSTKSLFLNLMAYEQSNLDCTNHITAYVVFMNDLINSAQDVSYLRNCGILEHWLDKDVEVADMFSYLCRQVVFNISDSYLSKVSEEVDVYYRRRSSVWKASLKYNYFHNPWAVIACLAAVFLILLASDHVEEHPPQTSQQEQQPETDENREIRDDGEASESQVPNDPDWIISIKERLEEAIQEDVAVSRAKHCIYRVPYFLRSEEEDKAYTPQVVSIGPYHRGRLQLLAMDRHKWRALYHILNRQQQDVVLYVNAMKELEERTRGCYEGVLHLTSNEFVEMMVLDGCFMIELLKGYVEGFRNLGYERNDPIFAMRGMMCSVRMDMMMIENQIPLFVLEKLFALQLGNPVKRELLAEAVAELVSRFFDPLSPTGEPLSSGQKIELESSIDAKEVKLSLSPDESGLHCLDLFRSSILRESPERGPWSSYRKQSQKNLVVRQKLIHSITELKECGIKFKKRKTDRFWDIKFKNGVLHIPRLLVHDGTKALFFNLVAYEQSHIDCTNDITAHIVFMNNLINSAQDVSYLRHNGILEHWLDNDVEVANMFSHLCRQVTFNISDSYLSKVSEEIDVYHRSRWSVWKASLKHNYFHNPWAVTAFLAAIFFILLTTAQTYYSVYSYYKPRN